jgi:hypothetical protein
MDLRVAFDRGTLVGERLAGAPGFVWLAFATEQRRLRQEKPALQSLGDLRVPPPEPEAGEELSPTGVSPEKTSSDEQPKPAPIFTPTYLRSPPAAPERSVDETVMGGVPRDRGTRRRGADRRSR